MTQNIYTLKQWKQKQTEKGIKQMKKDTTKKATTKKTAVKKVAKKKVIKKTK